MGDFDKLLAERESVVQWFEQTFGRKPTGPIYICPREAGPRDLYSRCVVRRRLPEAGEANRRRAR